MKSGMVLACTGVMRVKPMLETASRIHSDKAGVKASHALEDPLAAADFSAGAIVGVVRSYHGTPPSPLCSSGEGEREKKAYRRRGLIGTCPALQGLSPSHLHGKQRTRRPVAAGDGMPRDVCLHLAAVCLA